MIVNILNEHIFQHSHFARSVWQIYIRMYTKKYMYYNAWQAIANNQTEHHHSSYLLTITSDSVIRWKPCWCRLNPIKSQGGGWDYNNTNNHTQILNYIISNLDKSIIPDRSIIALLIIKLQKTDNLPGSDPLSMVNGIHNSCKGLFLITKLDLKWTESSCGNKSFKQLLHYSFKAATILNLCNEA